MIMASRKKFYVTTPIYYVNDKPHLGSFYTTLVADVMARWHRIKGDDVFFLTGTDENSQKSVEAAKKAGKTVESYVNEMATIWKDTFKNLNISFDEFIRTTEERHKKGVYEFFKRVNKKGDIYKGKYVGYYCVRCEAFLTKTDLVENKCPIHKVEPNILEEENYFFRASRYKDELLEYIEKNPKFILPEKRREEVIKYIKTAMNDISISRQTQEWGIEFPLEKGQVFYVWFDALINYLTGIGFGWDEEKFKRYWPADLHLIGKDITKFHCAIWPAMLLSADLELPKHIYIHGFWTVKGEKMSKSLGNVVDPIKLKEKYPLDAIRYFLVRQIPFGEDGDFDEEALKERINGELVNDLGNLVWRVLSLAEKFTGSFEGTPELEKYLNLEKIEFHMENFRVDLALQEIWNFIRQCNKYINEKEVWKLSGSELGNALYNLLESLRVISILLYPFMPETSEKIRKQLGLEKKLDLRDCVFKKFEGRIEKREILFKKIEN
ncbi:MAG: methionine--tRNA ligase [Candidatus Aenigmarchaeota archaeon]|nr:methionine--tRNA ligase [Candidatus Aenigmarchaeota archaeon]MCX8191131.1 methionine--tRNA ligase [Candidatus Aenigmarchaeota archaeon]MDW8160352.1 methionine--tRNA ligase [Candidatus Aenigmarchaeota archaeon]